MSDGNVDITELLAKPIAFHRVYAKLMGNASGGLFLSQLAYWSATMKRKEFYKTGKDWEEETCLSRREQEASRAKLVELGLLTVAKKGIPAKLYFKLDHDALTRMVVQFATSDKLVCTKKHDSLSHLANCDATSDKLACHISQTNTENKQRVIREEAENIYIPSPPPEKSASKPKPKPKAKPKAKPKTIEKPEGVDEQVWDDWIDQRKLLKASASKTVITRLQNQANAADMPLNEVLSIMLEKGWKTFNKNWVAKDTTRPLPDDFQFTAERQIACQKLAPELGDEIHASFNRFVAYAQSKGKRYQNWDAALEAWILGDLKQLKEREQGMKTFKERDRETAKLSLIHNLTDTSWAEGLEFDDDDRSVNPLRAML